MWPGTAADSAGDEVDVSEAVRDIAGAANEKHSGALDANDIEELSGDNNIPS
jgi:hypothetical protein